MRVWTGVTVLMAVLLFSGCALQATIVEGTRLPPDEVSSQVPLPQPEKEPATDSSAQQNPSEEISFTLDALSVAQGDILVLRAENLPTGVLPQVTTTLDYTPTFFAGEAGKATALLPIRSRTKSGSYTVTVSAADSSQSFAITVTEAGFQVEYIEMEQGIADSTLYNQAAADEFEELYQQMKSGVDAIYWQGEFIIPLAQESPRVSSDYGDTRYVNGSLSGRHGGVDFPAPLGTTVMATNSGYVAFSGYMQQTGYTVCIEHGMGLKSWYFHMSSLSCTTGDMVEKGQKIGEVGSTGASTGNHLHFALSVGGVYVNPWTIMAEGIGLWNL